VAEEQVEVKEETAQETVAPVTVDASRKEWLDGLVGGDKVEVRRGEYVYPVVVERRDFQWISIIPDSSAGGFFTTIEGDDRIVADANTGRSKRELEIHPRAAESFDRFIVPQVHRHFPQVEKADDWIVKALAIAAMRSRNHTAKIQRALGVQSKIMHKKSPCPVGFSAEELYCESGDIVFCVGEDEQVRLRKVVMRSPIGQIITDDGTEFDAYGIRHSCRVLDPKQPDITELKTVEQCYFPITQEMWKRYEREENLRIIRNSNILTPALRAIERLAWVGKTNGASDYAMLQNAEKAICSAFANHTSAQSSIDP